MRSLNLWKVNTKPVPAETSCDTAIMRRENGTYDLESTVGRPETEGQISTIDFQKRDAQ